MAGGVAGAGRVDLQALLELLRMAKQGGSPEKPLAEMEALLSGAAESRAQAGVAERPPEEEELPTGDIDMSWEVAEHELAGLDAAGQVAVYKANERKNKARAEKERAEREKEKAAKMQKTKVGVNGSIHK